MSVLRIGLGQLNTGDSIEQSFREIEKMTGECAGRGVKLVVFPELSTYLSESGTSAVAEDLDGSIIEKFKSLAVKHEVYIHNGSFIEKSPLRGKVFNTSVLINPSGKIETLYRKIHLFDSEINKDLSYRESDRFERGKEIVTAETPAGNFGFSICYDLRFPELFRALTLKGAKLIFVPAAFTLFTGKDHWEALLRARAIENQVYIAAPNQIGEHPVHKTCYGNSMIIDPWGKVVARASDTTGVITADIDWDYLEEVRTKLPSLKNRVAFENP